MQDDTTKACECEQNKLQRINKAVKQAGHALFNTRDIPAESADYTTQL